MRPTTAIIRLSALHQNLKTAEEFAPASKNVAVIKANAYGHGAVEVARALQSAVPAFAVAFFDEAVQLRDAGITRPILVLQGTSRDADVKEAACRDFWLMVHNQQQVEAVLSSSATRRVSVWLKADTGMHRLGLEPGALESACESLSSSRNVRKGMVLCTHLACADELENPLTQQQVAKLRSYAESRNLPLSIANSAAIMCWPQSHAAWNRPGYMLFGNSPLGHFGGNAAGLRPAMTMRSELISIRKLAPGDGVGYGQLWTAAVPSTIGTIPIGYGDGYPRHAPNGTPVFVNGRCVPLVGRVSMDLISVDLTGLEQVQVGDPVELWGEKLSVNEVAARAGTIGYELLAGLTGRVPLVYQP